MKAYNARCLVLNNDYTPISIISWQKALTWHIKYLNNKNYGIDILDFYKNDFIIGTNNKKHPVPCVARTKRFFKNRHSNVIFSRKNLFLRDNYTCQYCNIQYDAKFLTYDHIIPKSKWDYSHGSPTTWTNITTACVRCNLKKGNRTPKDANMPLKNLPIKPNKTNKYLPIAHHLRKIKDTIPPEWISYLPESYI
jgi:hypothetical protein